MSNVRQWLVDFEKQNNERIITIVVGEKARASVSENIVLGREEGLAKLNFEFDNGYGTAKCPPVTAWTDNSVIFIQEYDGATWLSSKPRNPIKHQPRF